MALFLRILINNFVLTFCATLRYNFIMEKLPGDYIAGFVDGEGCFALMFRRDRQKSSSTGKIREYFYWNAQFAIVLRPDDSAILNSIKDKLHCGSVTFKKKGDQARLSVQNINDLYDKIVPFFNTYRLRAKKSVDFSLWSEAVSILHKHKSGGLNIEAGKRGFTKKVLSETDTRRLKNIREKMTDYKSYRDKKFLWGSKEGVL